MMCDDCQQGPCPIALIPGEKCPCECDCEGPIDDELDALLLGVPWPMPI